MAGEEIEEAFVGFSGLMGDRTFAFVREPGPSGFPWLTGREQEDLILYRPRFIDAARALPRDVESHSGWRRASLPPTRRPRRSLSA